MIELEGNIFIFTKEDLVPMHQGVCLRLSSDSYFNSQFLKWTKGKKYSSFPQSFRFKSSKYTEKLKSFRIETQKDIYFDKKYKR